MTAAVITISDSTFAGARADKSGPAVRERLERLGWQVAVAEVLPDEADRIAARLAELADSGAVAGQKQVNGGRHAARAKRCLLGLRLLFGMAGGACRR